MTATQLIKAAKAGKAVTGFHCFGEIRMPAAFVCAMQFNRVMAQLPNMKVYQPARKKCPWSKTFSKPTSTKK